MEKELQTEQRFFLTVNTHSFIKEDKQWFIDLPDYLNQGGSKKDLEMIDGVDELLTQVAGSKKKVTLILDTNPFDGADLLELIEMCEAPKGGGYYLMHSCNNYLVNKRLWICDILLFVFGDLPEKIYLKKIKL